MTGKTAGRQRRSLDQAFLPPETGHGHVHHAKVSTLIRTHGRAHSEISPATEWQKFKAMIHAMPA